MKVVANGCFGGFGLSDDAIILYGELSGTPLYPKEDSYFTHWYNVPVDQLPKEPSQDLDYSDPEWENYRKINNDASFSDSDLDRTDPILVQVVEHLGDDASGEYSQLYVVDVPSGSRWRISEYDGLENVMTVDDYDWNIAT